MSAQSAAQASLAREWHCGSAGHPITLTPDTVRTTCVCGVLAMRRTDAGYQYEPTEVPSPQP